MSINKRFCNSSEHQVFVCARVCVCVCVCVCIVHMSIHSLFQMNMSTSEWPGHQTRFLKLLCTSIYVLLKMSFTSPSGECRCYQINKYIFVRSLTEYKGIQVDVLGNVLMNGLLFTYEALYLSDRGQHRSAGVPLTGSVQLTVTIIRTTRIHHQYLVS